MMLAVPPVAAAARALAVAPAAGDLVAADTHPPVTRTPANAAMASTDTNRVLCMTRLPLHQGCDWVALTAGSRPSGEPELPFAGGRCCRSCALVGPAERLRSPTVRAGRPHRGTSGS